MISILQFNLPGLPVNTPDFSSLKMTLPELPDLPDFSAITTNAMKVLEILLSITKNKDTDTNALYESFLPSLSKFMETYSLVLIILSLILGLLCGFFGYKLVKFFMTASGFFTGLVLGTIVGTRFLNASNGIVILCAIAGALILSLFSYKIYQAGIFVLCFFLTFIGVANYIPLSGNTAFFVCLICGLIVGIAALKFVRPVIIIASAFVGAHSATNAILGLGDKYQIEYLVQDYSRLLVFAGLILLGILFQFLTNREEAQKKARKRKKSRNRD